MTKKGTKSLVLGTNTWLGRMLNCMLTLKWGESGWNLFLRERSPLLQLLCHVAALL